MYSHLKKKKRKVYHPSLFNLINFIHFLLPSLLSTGLRFYQYHFNKFWPVYMLILQLWSKYSCSETTVLISSHAVVFALYSCHKLNNSNAFLGADKLCFIAPFLTQPYYHIVTLSSISSKLLVSFNSFINQGKKETKLQIIFITFVSLLHPQHILCGTDSIYKS